MLPMPTLIFSHMYACPPRYRSDRQDDDQQGGSAQRSRCRVLAYGIFERGARLIAGYET